MMLDIVEFRVMAVFAVIGIILTLLILGVVIALIIAVSQEEKARGKRNKLEEHNKSLECISKKCDALYKENRELKYKIDVLLNNEIW